MNELAKRWGKLPYEIWAMPAMEFQDMLDLWEIEAYEVNNG